MHFAHKVYLQVSYDSQSKQLLFPQNIINQLIIAIETRCFL
jgi:hypothetical protein